MQQRSPSHSVFLSLAGANVFNVSLGWKKSRSNGLQQVCVCVRTPVAGGRVTVVMSLLPPAAGGHSVHGLPEQVLQRQQEGSSRFLGRGRV